MTTHALYFKNHPIQQIYEIFIEATKEIRGKIEFGSCNNNLLLKTTNLQKIKYYDTDKYLVLGDIYLKDHKTYFNFPVVNTIEQLNFNYWGNYVLFTWIKDNLEIFIPQCNQSEIFYYETNEYVILSSEIFFFKNFTKLEFNYEYFKVFLLNSDFRSLQTPFHNINELPAGFKITFSSSSTCIKAIWKYDNYLTPKFLSIENAKTEIKNRFNLVIETILNKYDNIFLDLSGGLDSSSILLELCRNKKMCHKIYGINLSDISVNSSNEIEHVKKLQNNDFKLIQLDYNECLPFTQVDRYSILPNKPSLLLSHLKYQQTLNNIACNHHKNYCFVNGHGGDSVFNSPPAIGALSDLFKDKKFNQITTKAHELALHYRQSIWSIYNNNIKIYIKNQLKLYNMSLRKSIPMFLFSGKFDKKLLSFYDQLGNLKYPSDYSYCQIIDLTLANMHANFRSKNHNIYYPFMSLPVLETGLRIHSSDSFTAEYDRYIFRQAMYEQHQNDCVWRKDKGHTTGVFHKALNKNKNYILELACEGLLVNLGLIDKQEFLRLYDKVSAGFIDNQWALIHMLSLETFISIWKKHL